MTSASPSILPGEFHAQVAAYRQRERLRSAITIAVFLVALAAAGWMGEVDIVLLIEGIPGFFTYVGDTIPEITLANFWGDIQEWQWGFAKWMRLLLDTVIMAILATALGFTMGLLLCFAASRNLVRSRWICIGSRRLLEIFRTIPDLIYAMIFVFAFGIGPAAGILALALHSAGALGKLFSEVNENIDASTLDGVRSAGASWFETIRYGLLPQVFPNFLSYGLLRFEINVRTATVMGFVGAGGIGTVLMQYIRQFQYTSVSAVVVWIILLVMVIDFLSERARRRVMTGAGA